jgi:hypothetical protein
VLHSHIVTPHLTTDTMNFDPSRPVVEIRRNPFKKHPANIIRRYLCPYYSSCKQSFYRHEAFQRHVITRHSHQPCRTFFPCLLRHKCKNSQVGKGKEEEETVLEGSIPVGSFEIIQVVYRGVFLVLRKSFLKPLGVFSNAFDENILKHLIKFHKGIQAKISINATLVDSKEEKTKTITFFSPFMRYLNEGFILGNVMSSADFLITSLNVFAEDESGYKLSSVNYMQIDVGKYKPLKKRRGKFIPTPRLIGNRNVLNIRTNSELCFIISILCSLKRDSIRLSDSPSTPFDELNGNQKRRIRRLYENEKSYFPLLKEMMKTKEIDVDGFLRAMSLEDIDEFEERNPTISVSVFAHEEKELFPLRCPKIVK